MITQATIKIIGAPIACTEGIKDTWRELAHWAAQQLQQRYGLAIEVIYYDLFDPDCPPLPHGVQLPLVLIDGEILSSGGKISIPAIRKRLEAMGIKTHA